MQRIGNCFFARCNEYTKECNELTRERRREDSTFAAPFSRRLYSKKAQNQNENQTTTHFFFKLTFKLKTMNTVTSIAISLASIFSFFTAEFSSPASSPEKTAIESNVLASPPDRVKVNGKGCNSLSSSVIGIYTKVAESGNSSCGCWNGPNNASLGKVGNDWRIFSQPGCTGSASWVVGSSSSCNPRDVSCITEPKVVISAGCNSIQTANLGTYEKSSTNNASTCGCWNRIKIKDTDQPQSFGQIGGMWVIFFAQDCPTPTGNGAGQYVPLKTDSSCDPLVVGCVKLD